MPAEKPTQCSRRNGNKGVDVISANVLKSEEGAQKNPASGNNKKILSRIFHQTRKISVAYIRPNHGTYEFCLMSETPVVSLLQISYKL